MIYPKELQKRIPEIESIIASWPVQKPIDEVMSWILQFDDIDFDIAIRIIRNLNVIGPKDLESALSVAYSKLIRHSIEKDSKITNTNTVYLTFGSAAKSGSMIAYHFRNINGLASEYFLSQESLGLIKDGKISNLVLLDDIIASGNQSSKLLHSVSDTARKLGINNIYVLTAIGFKTGIDKIANTQLADVFAAIEYDDCDTVNSKDSSFYSGMTYEARQTAYQKLTNKYKGIGFEGLGALLSFYYNTPNTTLHCIWNSSNGWIPLFQRKFDLNIEGPKTYSVDDLTRLNTAEVEVKKNECNIYVEGKLEELFLQELAKQHNKFGYESLNIISIGPFYSQPLVEELRKLAEKTYFVTTEPLDNETPHIQNIKASVGEDNITYMKPVLTNFDITKVQEAETFSKILDWDFINEKEDESYKWYLIESKLFKKAVMTYRIDNIRELVEHCSIEGAFDDVINILKKK